MHAHCSVIIDCNESIPMKLSLNSNLPHTKKHCTNNAMLYTLTQGLLWLSERVLQCKLLKNSFLWNPPWWLVVFLSTSSEQWTLAARKKGQTVARYTYHHHHHHQSSVVRMQVWEKSLMQLLSNGGVHKTHLWTALSNMFWRVKLWWLFGIFGIRDPHPQSIFWPKTVFRANKPFWKKKLGQKRPSM